jgi:hypothetical protein
MTWTNDASSCVHENEVLELVSMDQWPARADATLLAHAATCAVCRDMVAAAGAIAELRDEVASPAHVPDASVVWYRAQVRARAEAAQRATRPMFVAQAVAVTCLLGLGLAWFRSGAAGLAGWWQWLTGLMPSAPSWSPSDVAAGAQGGGRYVAAAVIGFVLVALVAVYIAEMADTAPLEKRER